MLINLKINQLVIFGGRWVIWHQIRYIIISKATSWNPSYTFFFYISRFRLVWILLIFYFICILTNHCVAHHPFFISQCFSVSCFPSRQSDSSCVHFFFPFSPHRFYLPAHAHNHILLGYLSWSKSSKPNVLLYFLLQWSWKIYGPTEDDFVSWQLIEYQAVSSQRL